MPETQSQEKIDFLRMIGADLRLIPAKPYKDPGNYVHVSRRMAEAEGWFWANQFDNLDNREGHRRTTGAEIIAQAGGKVDAFTCACGTGGTLAGVSLALKALDASTRIVLADPLGSALYAWRRTGEVTMSEGGSITEGIGQSRVPENLQGVDIDDAVQVRDEAALEQVFDLTRHEGLCIGGSAGINVAAAIAVARQMGPGHRIVTILCDGGARYQSKLFNPEFLRGKNLPVPPWLT